MRRDVEPELRSNPRIGALLAAIKACGTDEDLLLRFLRDTLTRQQLRQAADRWAVAQCLLDNHTQAHCTHTLKLSPGTVSRAHEWVDGSAGTGGWADTYERLQSSTINNSNP